VSGPLDWTLATVAAATRGVVDGDPAMPVGSVGIDSRHVAPGSVFVAVRGERFDGHAFALDAIGAGAVAAVVERGCCPGIVPRVDVADTGTALRDLAAHRRAELSIPVVAITGSTGKTSTKDLLASVLPGSWASPRSFNNEVGVPLTVLSTPRDARSLVLEVGSRGLGHIRWLAPVVQPDVAVVTNIGVVHLETFETRTSIADAKWELVTSLPERGTAVLPDDEPLLVREHPGPTFTFGTSSTASVRITDLELDDSGIPRFHLHAGGARAAVELSMAGEHQAHNAAAAAAAALALGIELDDIVPGLAAATGSPWRMEVIRGRFTVVNDAYNANPDSMAAGLRTVAAIPGRSIAVLGLMAELGTVSEAEHRQIGLLARDLGFSHVFVVGEDHGIAEAAGAIAQSHPDIASADEAVRAVIEPGDVVLVKASRAAGLERIAIDLAEESVA